MDKLIVSVEDEDKTYIRWMGASLRDDDILCSSAVLRFYIRGPRSRAVGGLLGKNRKLDVGHEAVVGLAFYNYAKQTT